MTADVSRLPVVHGPTPKGLQIQTWDDVLARAEFFAKSQLIPVALRGKPADVAIILQMGAEVGFNPMQALNSIDVIQGKPAIKPEAQLALIYQMVPEALITIDVDPVGRKVTVAMGRSEGKAQFRTVWDMKRVAEMGLANKENYQKQPLVMLKWRAVGEAARTVFPDIIRGMYNSFEAEDFTENTGSGSNADDIKSRFEQKPEPKDVVSEVAPKPPVEPVLVSSPEPDFDQPEPVVIPAKKSAMESIQDIAKRNQAAAMAKSEPEVYRVPFGKKHIGKTLAEIGRAEVQSYSDFLQDSAAEKGEPLSGLAAEFVSQAYDFLNGPQS